MQQLFNIENEHLISDSDDMSSANTVNLYTEFSSMHWNQKILIADVSGSI